MRLDSLSSNFKSFSRMNSKISMLSKKRTGIKTKVDEFNNKVAGIDLNVQKLLEDVWNMKTREKNNIALISKLQETVEKFQQSYDKCLNDQVGINLKLEDIKKQFEVGMKMINHGNANTEHIQASIGKQINSFSKEYQDGFKRIIKLEINSSHHKNMLDLLEKARKENRSTNFDDYISHSKFDIKGITDLRNEMKRNFDSLYQQLQEMAADQAKFNFETNEDISKLDLLIKEEINIIKRENEVVLREVRRAERNITDCRQYNSISQAVDRHLISKIGFSFDDCKSDVEAHNFSKIDKLKIKASVFSPFNKSRATNVSHKHCLSDDGKSKPQYIARNRNAFSSVKQNREVKSINKTIDGKRPETTKFTKLKRFKFFGKNRDIENQSILRLKFNMKNDLSVLQ